MLKGGAVGDSEILADSIHVLGTLGGGKEMIYVGDSSEVDGVSARMPSNWHGRLNDYMRSWMHATLHGPHDYFTL